MAAVAKALPTTPPAWGWEYKIARDKWGMMGNSLAGCCVLSMIGHLILCWTSNTGNPIAPTEGQILDLYKLFTGYDPRQPHPNEALDTGLVVTDALDYWKSTGIECTDAKGKTTIHKILGYASLDVANVLQLDAATYIFEGIACGVKLPQSAVDNLVNWKGLPKTKTAGGHGVPRLGRGRLGGHFISWGVSIPHDVPFLVNLDESYAVVSEDQVNAQTGKSVSGFDQAGLLDAMAAAA